MIRWISVEDSLPDPGVDVIFVIDNSNDLCFGYMCHGDESEKSWVNKLEPDINGDYDFCRGTTHWMPKPFLPLDKCTHDNTCNEDNYVRCVDCGYIKTNTDREFWRGYTSTWFKSLKDALSKVNICR